MNFRTQVDAAGHRWALPVRKEEQQILDATSLHCHLEPNRFSVLVGAPGDAALRSHCGPPKVRIHVLKIRVSIGSVHNRLKSRNQMNGMAVSGYAEVWHIGFAIRIDMADRAAKLALG